MPAAFHSSNTCCRNFRVQLKDGRVVVDQLGVRALLAHRIHHGGDLRNVRLFGFDPEQIRAMLEAGDAVEDDAVEAGVFLERVQAIVQTLRLTDLAALVDGDVAVVQLVQVVHLFRVQELAVLIAQIARLDGHGYSSESGRRRESRCGRR